MVMLFNEQADFIMRCKFKLIVYIFQILVSFSDL